VVNHDPSDQRDLVDVLPDVRDTENLVDHQRANELIHLIAARKISDELERACSGQSQSETGSGETGAGEGNEGSAIRRPGHLRNVHQLARGFRRVLHARPHVQLHVGHLDIVVLVHVSLKLLIDRAVACGLLQPVVGAHDRAARGRLVPHPFAARLAEGTVRSQAEVRREQDQ
jgi:hypothetical protein